MQEDFGETGRIETITANHASDVALSVVIPCCNEGEVLHELRRRLVPICEDIAGEDFEIVLVDDGSTDRTRALIDRFVDEDARFVGVFLSRNHGHQLALTAGLSFSRGQRILVIDADLQDPPELLPEMMALMDSGNEVVYGRRRERKGETVFKRTTASLFYRILRKLVDVDIPLDAGDFRLMSRKALDVLNSMPESQRFIRGMISWIGFRQAALAYDRDERFAGETKYPLRKMVSFAVDGLTSFSVVPLRAATFLGLLGASLSVPVFIYIAASWISGNVVQGWVSLMLVVLLLGSLQLIVLGIIREYVGRMYLQSKKRPIFVVDQLRRHEKAEVAARDPASRSEPVDVPRTEKSKKPARR